MVANSLTRNLLTGILFLAGTLSAVSCSSEKYLKDYIIAEIHNANGKDITLDLNGFSKEKILRLCIQSPYLTKDAMEKRVGTKIGDFNEVDDNFFILWAFTGRQAPMRIKFHRWHELNFGEQSRGCTATSKVKIVNSRLFLNEEQ